MMQWSGRVEQEIFRDCEFATPNHFDVNHVIEKSNAKKVMKVMAVSSPLDFGHRPSASDSSCPIGT